MRREREREGGAREREREREVYRHVSVGAAVLDRRQRFKTRIYDGLAGWLAWYSNGSTGSTKGNREHGGEKHKKDGVRKTGRGRESE